MFDTPPGEYGSVCEGHPWGWRSAELPRSQAERFEDRLDRRVGGQVVELKRVPHQVVQLLLAVGVLDVHPGIAPHRAELGDGVVRRVLDQKVGAPRSVRIR